MYKKLRVHLGKSGNFYLDFDLLKNPITELWLERMECRFRWRLDDPERFYGFNSTANEENRALTQINKCIETINKHASIIDRHLYSVDDQDTLNYLHNIFERYHGMLDQQNHEFWYQAPDQVRQALANLNVAVHRCESVSRGQRPRFVCTWWGMPKEKQLPISLIKEYGQLTVDFGGVYLNYVEIGKTLLELAVDKDQYIADEMFKPFNFYSADFVVYFYSSTAEELLKNQQLVDQYYNQHREFFVQLGINNTSDYRAKQLKFKVAQLQNANQANLISTIKNHQYIRNIELL